MRYSLFFFCLFIFIGCSSKKTNSLTNLNLSLNEKEEIKGNELKKIVESKKFQDGDYLYITDSINLELKKIQLKVFSKRFSPTEPYIDRYIFDICINAKDSIIVLSETKKNNGSLSEEFVNEFNNTVPHSLKKETPYLHVSISCPALINKSFDAWNNYAKTINSIIHAYKTIRIKDSQLFFRKKYSNLTFNEKLKIVKSKPISIYLTFNTRCKSTPPPPPPTN
ncbi:hypothetical protein RBU60_09615 [Mesonia sp. MT50]|uniref:Lipoprotein n=1 Tax=Mesonia profundi TaxID=3070998 RepID=A0ABU1A2C9_9FLAO|nr:hypothetical protein [Mesonia profundi]MDQ7917832.1 hypothetical protein [Mesonia profundi]